MYFITFIQNRISNQNRNFALTLIFSRMNSLELHRCSLVCREWKRLSRNEKLWKIICFKNIRMTPEVLIKGNLCKQNKLQVLQRTFRETF